MCPTVYEAAVELVVEAESPGLDLSLTLITGYPGLTAYNLVLCKNKRCNPNAPPAEEIAADYLNLFHRKPA
jgi:hypothetical protein